MPVGCGILQGARNINMDPKKGKNYAAKFEVWTGLADESVKFQKKWFKRFFYSSSEFTSFENGILNIINIYFVPYKILWLTCADVVEVDDSILWSSGKIRQFVVELFFQIRKIFETPTTRLSKTLWNRITIEFTRNDNLTLKWIN